MTVGYGNVRYTKTVTSQGQVTTTSANQVITITDPAITAQGGIYANYVIKLKYLKIDNESASTIHVKLNDDDTSWPIAAGTSGEWDYIPVTKFTVVESGSAIEWEGMY